MPNVFIRFITELINALEWMPSIIPYDQAFRCCPSFHYIKQYSISIVLGHYCDKRHTLLRVTYTFWLHSWFVHQKKFTPSQVRSSWSFYEFRNTFISQFKKKDGDNFFLNMSKLMLLRKFRYRKLLPTAFKLTPSYLLFLFVIGVDEQSRDFTHSFPLIVFHSRSNTFPSHRRKNQL